MESYQDEIRWKVHFFREFVKIEVKLAKLKLYREKLRFKIWVQDKLIKLLGVE